MTRRSILAFFLLSNFADAFVIERSEIYTIATFSSDDFGDGRIQEDSGWRLGCLLETKPFLLPDSMEAEVEVVLHISGMWKNIFRDTEEILSYRLATIELSYIDIFGNDQFRPKMLHPSILGPILSKTGDNRLSLYGGSLDQRRTINLGPIVLKRGSSNIIVGLCGVAPETTFQVHDIQIRVRPLR